MLPYNIVQMDQVDTTVFIAEELINKQRKQI